MHSVGGVIKNSLLQKLTQVSMRQVLHYNRQRFPLSNNAQHMCYVGITHTTQLFHRLVKCSSTQTSYDALSTEKYHFCDQSLQ